MDRLFRDRMAYIQGDVSSEECFLCKAADSKVADASNLVLTQGERTLVVLNRYPYNTGHLIVATKRHVGELEDLDDEEASELMGMTSASIKALRRAFEPEGFNLGANLGRVAGAGLPDHFHFHVVPRWGGDTNFMPVTASSKVLPETLEETYERMAELFT